VVIIAPVTPSVTMPLLADNLRSLQSTLIVGSIVVVALLFGQPLLMPLAFAVIIAFILSPVVSRLSTLNISESVAAVFVVGIALLLLIGISFALSAQVLSLTAEIATYQNNLMQKVRAIADLSRGDSVLDRSMRALHSLAAAVEREIGVRATAPEGGTVLVVRDTETGGSVAILKTVGGVFAPLAQIGLTVLLTVFLLLGHRDIRDRLVRIAGTDHISGTAAAISNAGARLSQYFLSLSLINMAFGCVVGLLLWAIGIPNPLLWGVLTMMMRYVPFIGTFIAAAPPILLAAAVDPGWSMVVATIAVFAIGEPLMGSVLEPVVIGKKAGLTAFGMILAVAFWTLVWGPIGLLVAAPLTTAVVIFGRYLPGLEFFSVMFGDDPALSPEHQLYHRLLTGDSVAAAVSLKDAIEATKVSHVSDTIVLPAIALAAFDQRAKLIEPNQLATFRETAIEAIELAVDAAGDATVEAKPGATPNVYVVPARGEVDRTAAEMIACLIGHETSCAVTALTQSAGLTAIAGLHSQAHGSRIDALILVTVGGVEDAHLELLSQRAVRTFPTARQFMLSAGSARDPAASRKPTDRIYRTLSPIVDALRVLKPASCAEEARGGPSAFRLLTGTPEGSPRMT
jgi:predicted PurR-regulated permease PerM